MHRVYIFLLLSTGFLTGLVPVAESAIEVADQIDETRLDDDSEFRSLEVNEGELTFIQPVTGKPTLHSEIELTISKHSIATGWVKLRQCYFNINPVDATDIVYR